MKGHRLASCCNEWKNYKNTQTNYELVYEHMIVAGVATLLPEFDNYFFNSKVEVFNEPDNAGLRFSLNISHPDYILLGDKVGKDRGQEDYCCVVSQTCLSFIRTIVNISII